MQSTTQTTERRRRRRKIDPPVAPAEKTDSGDPLKSEVVAERLRMLSRRNGGVLTPEHVVADAKKKSSPLHDLFEWDLTRAAANHWIERARVIIRSVRYEVRTEKVSYSLSTYTRDPDADNGAQGYADMARLRTDAEAGAEMLRQQVRSAIGHVRRVHGYAIDLGDAAVTKAMAKVIAIMLGVAPDEEDDTGSDE